MSRQVALSKGYFAIVDDDDFERVSEFKWNASVAMRRDGSIRTVYAARGISIGGKNTTLYLHRFIMEISDKSIDVDHADHNGLNCTRSNLRVALRKQNNANSRKSANKSSRFKGVSWFRQTSRWHAQITVSGRRLHLGYFLSENSASEAYRVAAMAAYGEFANAGGE